VLRPLSFRSFSVATALGLSLAIAGCASQQQPLQQAFTPGGGGGAATPGSPEDFRVNVGDRVFFTTDSSTLSPQARATLDRQVAWLAQHAGSPILIEGHADERGTREYNLALGARRAEAVRDYLISRGVPANRIRTVSYGKERPVEACNAPRCWDQNRRGVTVVGGGIT
jgi:peptidoglycan-associated lipoprotein